MCSTHSKCDKFNLETRSSEGVMRLCGGLVAAYLYTSDKFVRIVCACWICAIALICHPEEVGATAGDEEAKRGAADYIYVNMSRSKLGGGAVRIWF